MIEEKVTVQLAGLLQEKRESRTEKRRKAYERSELWILYERRAAG